MLLILARCPAHCPLMHRTVSIISFTPVLHFIISSRILSLFVMFNNNISMLHWVTASFFSWCFVRAHVSAPEVIAGKITASMIVLFRQIGIFLSFKKWLYSPNLLHPDVILWAISLLMSLPDVTNLPEYLYSVTFSNCSPSIITPVLSLLLATSLHKILVFFLFSFIPSLLPSLFRSSSISFSFPVWTPPHPLPTLSLLKTGVWD